MSPTTGKMATFENRDGLRLTYDVLDGGSAEADRPPLLCQPGGPGRAAAYLEDLAGLAATRRLVRLDSRGTGRSEPPRDPTAFGPGDLAGDLDDLRRHLGLERPDVLGHSAGARVAMTYATSYPVRRLVLVTTWLVPPRPDDVAAVLEQRRGEPWYAEAREAYDVLAGPDGGVPAAEQKRLQRLVRPFYYARWDDRCREHAGSADRQMSPRAEAGFRAAVEPADVLAPRLAAVDVPVLVVAGALDPITPPACGEQVAAAFPAADLVVLPDAGHFPWVDTPAMFGSAVENFLA